MFLSEALKHIKAKNFVQGCEKVYNALFYSIHNLALKYGVSLDSHKERDAFIEVLKPLAENRNMFFLAWSSADEYYFQPLYFFDPIIFRAYRNVRENADITKGTMESLYEAAAEFVNTVKTMGTEKEKEVEALILNYSTRPPGQCAVNGCFSHFMSKDK